MIVLTPATSPPEIIEVHNLLSVGRGDIAEPLHRVIDKKSWENVGCKTFAQLIYEGWGHRRSYLEEWCKNSPSLVERIKKAAPDADITAYEVDAVTKPLAVRGKETGRGSRSDNVTSNRGNSAEHTASRLARDNPELHEQVRSGDLTLNQAAIKAGWRKPTMTIPQDPLEAAEAIKRRYEKTEIDLLVASLTNNLIQQ